MTSSFYPENSFSFAFSEPKRPFRNQDLPPILNGALLSAHGSDKSRPDDASHLWLDLPEGMADKVILEAGLDRRVLLQQGAYPRVHVPLTLELKEAIEKVSTCEAHGSNVYLQLAQSGGLWMKYQGIMGSHKLSVDNPDFVKKLTRRLSEALANDPVFTNPVERFRENSETGKGEVVKNGQRISALLTTIGSVLNDIDKGLAPKPAVVRDLSSGVVPVDSAHVKNPVIDRALSARSVAVGRSSNASEAVLGDLAKLFVDPASPQNLRLPAEHLANYAKVKALVTTAGGKYNSKGFFSFPEGIDPAGVQQILLGGAIVNDKKDFQFFPTPRAEALDLCDRAGPLDGKRVLEPSAGDGALADIARERGADVVVVENWPVNVSKLKAKGYDVLEKDFLTVTPEDIGLFDVILANPPFSKNQDIDHVRHMMSFLEPGGVLSVITSQAWERGTQKKQLAFADFLKEIDAVVVPVAAGAFKESGTDVPTFKIVIEKPLAPRPYLSSHRP